MINTLSKEYTPKVSRSVIKTLNSKTNIAIDFNVMDILFRRIYIKKARNIEAISVIRSKVKELTFKGMGTIKKEINPRTVATNSVELITWCLKSSIRLVDSKFVIGNLF